MTIITFLLDYYITVIKYDDNIIIAYPSKLCNI